ncbi:Ig-like domain-containing protein [Sodalis ligni]|uniref:Ig-like domain-containing protein n=1 Tax=Sodalis ligni TaxID=2697027 RepID=UPI00193EC69F|nr:Ig-like domain-containing protein [Sodalis ligni]QWA11942.1 Ig-like domain-containing protein [Sodalis ligni]
MLTGEPGSNTSSTRIGVLPVAAEITAANLNATKNDSIANGSDYNKARAKATDAAGTPVAGQTVTFTATTAAGGTFHVVTPGINEGMRRASSITDINAQFSSFSMLIQPSFIQGG